MLVFKSLLVFLICGTLTSAGSLEKNCQKIDGEKNVDYNKLLGFWYKKNWFGNELLGPCGFVNYANFNLGGGFQVNIDGETASAVLNGNNSARLKIGNEVYNHIVVKTDYDHFLIVYLCGSGTNELLPENVWVLSRSQFFIPLEDDVLVGKLGFQNGIHCISETSTENQTETSTENQTETSTEDSTETSTENQTETSTENQTETSPEESTETSTENQTESGPDTTAVPTEQPTMPKGFRVPGSDKTFYFVAQFSQNN